MATPLNPAKPNPGCVASKAIAASPSTSRT